MTRIFLSPKNRNAEAILFNLCLLLFYKIKLNPALPPNYKADYLTGKKPKTLAQTPKLLEFKLTIQEC